MNLRVYQLVLLRNKLYWVPRATITKYHKLDGLKQQILILTVLEARSLKSRCQQAVLLLKALG